MKYICILASLMFLASCQEETIPDSFPCQLMTISDALPVQFWLSDCDTYNETVPKGVHEACFCAPWQCDDEIIIQFKDETGGDFSLLVVNSDATVLAGVGFTEISEGVYSASFTPIAEGICDEDVQLLIVNNSDVATGSEILVNPTFTSEIDPWTSEAGAGQNWVWGSDKVTLTFVGAGPSDPLEQTFADNPAGTYLIQYNIESDPTTQQTLIVRVYNSGVLVQEILNINPPLGTADSTTFSHIIEISAPFDQIKISVDMASAFATFGLTNFSLKPVTAGSDVVAKSDCLNVVAVQDETELIRYSNERNVAGLVYANMSPDPAFSLRVPCRFFHEDFPEEDEAMELTSSVITTSSSMKTQKLLEVKHAPYYFHKKVKIILKHHSVTIRGVAYKKEEKYEINKGNPRWPMKSATCLLTEKNSVLRNVL